MLIPRLSYLHPDRNPTPGPAPFPQARSAAVAPTAQLQTRAWTSFTAITRRLPLQNVSRPASVKTLPQIPPMNAATSVRNAWVTRNSLPTSVKAAQVDAVQRGLRACSKPHMWGSVQTPITMFTQTRFRSFRMLLPLTLLPSARPHQQRLLQLPQALRIQVHLQRIRHLFQVCF